MSDVDLNCISIAQRIRIGVLLGSFLLGAAQAQSVQTTPREIAQHFCEDYRKNTTIPPYEKYATPELLERVRQARALSEAYAKKYPNHKPPFGDGVPFVSNSWDVMHHCRPKRIIRTPPGVEAEIRFFNVDEIERGAWTDRLRLVRRNDVWAIDDVLFRAPGQRHASLRQAIRQEFATAQKSEKDLYDSLKNKPQ